VARIVALGPDATLPPECASHPGPVFSNHLQALPEVLKAKAQPIPAGDLPQEALVVLVPSPMERLVAIVDRLLGPGGCPWDQAQTHESLKPHLLEEAYEVLEAIDAKDLHALREELGDLMLQPVMHAQMQSLAGGFDSDRVAQEIGDKLVRRHPHVFGTTHADTPEKVLENWDRIKAAEKGGQPRSVLAGLPNSMPALLLALEMSKRAARTGFEWPDLESVFDKLHEEERELREAIKTGERVKEELGDLLFTVANIARWCKVDPEDALRQMLSRFSDRFQQMERAADKPLTHLSAQEWDELWERAKAAPQPQS